MKTNILAPANLGTTLRLPRGLLPLLLWFSANVMGLAQPVITNQPQPLALAPGSIANFTVGVSGAAPLAYQWQRNIGPGFSDLANCTNAVLTLTNVQAWEAWDYLAVVADLNGARTSAVAHLYVMAPPTRINRVVLDNFDDNHLTGWSPKIFKATLLATNQQLVVRGSWPGVITRDITDTVAAAYLEGDWSVQNGETLEWRVDLISMNEHATSACVELLEKSMAGAYVFFKGRDFIHICKPSLAGGLKHAPCVHEKVLLPNTNVVLAFALTRLSPDLILTARVLDKTNPSTVLYERSFVDTPKVDRTLTPSEFEAISGMHLNTGSDIEGAPWTSFLDAGLLVWQYNYDGKQPAAEATFDNFELWTYRVPITRYVDASCASPAPPYTNWLTAARVIQDAVDAAAAGDEIIVTNGLYATGGRAVGTNLLVNRVAVDKPLTLRSVNGPQFTIIQGYQVPGTTNGDGAIRCVYLADRASLSGFTVTNGATRTNADYFFDQSGGGVWCESTNVFVSECMIAGNFANLDGGGAYSGTLNKCTLTGNSALGGGGAWGAVLNNCTLTANRAGWDGGGASWATLNNCSVAGNSASEYGGGAADSTLSNCTVTRNSASRGGGLYNAWVASMANNCIVYFNTAPTAPNSSSSPPITITLNYSCTMPMPTNGVGNITHAPLFVDFAGGNLRLQSNSPCINTGNNAYAPGPTDLDGNPRIVSGTVDIGAYEFQGPGSLIFYAWLQRYGLPTDGSADFLDPDGDGMNTWQEWRCQTDPIDALSVLRLLSAARAGTNVAVTWQSVAGVNYFLERSTNLSAIPPFMPLTTAIPGQVGATTFTDTNAASLAPLFYRVGVVP